MPVHYFNSIDVANGASPSTWLPRKDDDWREELARIRTLLREHDASSHPELGSGI